MADADFKRCLKCGETKPLEAFKKHKTSRGGRCSKCKECANVETRAWKAANKRRVREYNARYHSEHATEISKRREGYAHRYYEQNRDFVVGQLRKYRAENREKLYTRIALWQKNNRDKTRIYKSNNRIKRRGAPGSHTAADIKRLFKLQRGTCAYCPTKLTRYHVDHVMPLVKGGSNGPENLQLLCPTCNLRKGARHPLDFARMIGKLL